MSDNLARAAIVLTLNKRNRLARYFSSPARGVFRAWNYLFAIMSRMISCEKLILREITAGMLSCMMRDIISNQTVDYNSATYLLTSIWCSLSRRRQLMTDVPNPMYSCESESNLYYYFYIVRNRRGGIREKASLCSTCVIPTARNENAERAWYVGSVVARRRRNAW